MTSTNTTASAHGYITDTTTGARLRVCRVYRTSEERNDRFARLAVTEDRRVWLGYPEIHERWSHAGTLGDHLNDTTMSATNARRAANM